MRAAPRPENKATGPDAATPRVSVDKVDQLINLVGELVITQAMLAQNSKSVDSAVFQQMMAGLTDLERNTRDLQVWTHPNTGRCGRCPGEISGLAGNARQAIKPTTRTA